MIQVRGCTRLPILSETGGRTEGTSSPYGLGAPGNNAQEVQRNQKIGSLGPFGKPVKERSARMPKEEGRPSESCASPIGVGHETSTEVGQRYGAGEPVFRGGKRRAAAATALGRSESCR